MKSNAGFLGQVLTGQIDASFLSTLSDKVAVKTKLFIEWGSGLSCLLQMRTVTMPSRVMKR